MYVKDAKYCESLGLFFLSWGHRNNLGRRHGITRISHKDLNDLPKMLMPLKFEIKYPVNVLS